VDPRGRRSILNQILVDSRNQEPPNECNPQPIVVIWDQHLPRLTSIARAVHTCEAYPNPVEGYPDIEAIKLSTRCNVALVALGEYPSHENRSLEVVRILKQKGFKIICYEDNVKSWPLGVQCQPLLAGSLRLLDSAHAGFALELSRLLAQLLRAEVARRADEQRIKFTMRNLGIIGESAAMISIFRWIERVSALSDLPLLITGETGTGKQVLAHAIHRLDPKRRHGPFVAVNCAAISPSLAESELFGHRRGAFTGADRERQGLIRAAQGGILFLDEIGELDDTLQVKLLRVLQERRVLGVGDDQEVPVSLRVIAATNRNLSAAVQHGKFRADLFHRLNVLSIHIPSLRERRADVGPLIEHLLEKNQSLQTAGSVSAGPDFIEALTRIDLPGNVRQLENLVRRALVNKVTSTPLTLTDLPAEIWQQLAEQEDSYGIRSAQTDSDDPCTPARETAPQTLSSDLVNLLDTHGWSLAQTLRYCERILLEAALRRKQGNQSQTARLLGLTPRSIYSKIRRYHLNNV
jgi:transcriptional regulator with GAF, ATPase, and Fis domain